MESGGNVPRMEAYLKAIMEGQANLYARFNGIPDPYPDGDDRSAQAEDRFKARAVVEARKPFELTDAMLDDIHQDSVNDARIDAQEAARDAL
jgi:hypothetical protein